MKCNRTHSNISLKTKVIVKNPFFPKISTFMAHKFLGGYFLKTVLRIEPKFY